MNEQTCVQHTVLSGLDGLIGGRFVLMNKIGLLFKQILLLVCCFCVCVCVCHHIQDVFVIPLYICMSPRCRLHPTALFFHGCRLVAEQLTAALTAGDICILGRSPRPKPLRAAPPPWSTAWARVDRTREVAPPPDNQKLTDIWIIKYLI